MFTLLGTLIQWIVTMAVRFLPVSPIQQIELGEGVQQGLAWLNWLVPISDMLAIMDVWLLALLAWRVYRFVMAWTTSVFELAGND